MVLGVFFFCAYLYNIWFVLVITVSHWNLIYNRLGHQIVVRLAFELLDSRLHQHLCGLLPKNIKCNPMKAAVWADHIKGKPKFAWSFSLHYINSTDNPPLSCDRNYSHIMKDNDNIITAIHHFFLIAKNSQRSLPVRQMAMLFLVHLMGDLHNPLHRNNLTISLLSSEWKKSWW